MESLKLHHRAKGESCTQCDCMTDRHSKHTRQASQAEKGGIIEKEAPVAVSNVVLVCPKCGKTTKTGTAQLADGRKVRRCKRCNETLSDES